MLRAGHAAVCLAAAIRPAKSLGFLRSSGVSLLHSPFIHASLLFSREKHDRLLLARSLGESIDRVSFTRRGGGDELIRESDFVRRSSLSTMAARASKSILKGVVFDMDGTLTVPCIDFGEMRRRIGAKEKDILHEIEGWSNEKRAQAYRIITEIELEANARMQVMPGALELCAMLDSRQIRRGLITRNVKTSVDHFHSHFSIPRFDPALSREFRPYKPDPGPLLHICEQWQVAAHEVIMIGDSAKDDIVCGNRAGAVTVLLDEDGRYQVEDLLKEEKPTFKIRKLSELATILTNNFE